MGVRRYSRSPSLERWQREFDALQALCRGGSPSPSIRDLTDHGIRKARWRCSAGFSCMHGSEAFSPPFPNHIKIDVDGIEEQIVNGARKTLADPRVKSVSIELDEGQSDLYGRIIGAMANAGLKLHASRHADEFVPGEKATIYNCWFRRG